MVVILIRNAFAHDFGGAERFPVHLAKQLNMNNIQTTVISSQPRLLKYAESQHIPRQKGIWLQKQNWSGWRILLLPIYFLWVVWLTKWYIRAIHDLGADIVHPQSRDDFIAATFAAKLKRKRVIWTDHADLKYIYQNTTKWYKNPVGHLVKYASRFADVITVVSHNELTHIAKALGSNPDKKYRVIHNGVSDISTPPLSRDNRDKDCVIYCATSRLVEAKGISELITAFRTLKMPDIRLWLVGDGPDEKVFREQASDDQRIVFWGHKDDPLPYVATSDVFVHPSHHEGFSLSIVEAAMLGKPIIACNTGGNPEIVTSDNGILVPISDEDALAEAMRRLYDNHNFRDKLSKQSRKDFLNNFRFETIVKERFVPLYEKTKH